tara:strand:- start:580 stop:1050 length:471 start_codon:yes stop_codon:yes gene_type:complete
MRVLGIDPGSKVTGYGVIQIGDRGPIQYIASGSIRTTDNVFPARLGEIYRGVVTIIETYKPAQLAIEDVFVSKNVSSALKLGQARGVAIAAAVASELLVFEYGARKVKKSLVGTGNAGKEQVQHMVSAILNLNELPPTDAADALAIAICHVNTSLS